MIGALCLVLNLMFATIVGVFQQSEIQPVICSLSIKRPVPCIKFRLFSIGELFIGFLTYCIVRQVLSNVESTYEAMPIIRRKFFVSRLVVQKNIV